MSTSNCTRFRALACGALLVAFVLAGATSAHAATRPDCPNADVELTASDTDDVRAAVLCLINADRTQRRLTPLRESCAPPPSRTRPTWCATATSRTPAPA